MNATEEEAVRELQQFGLKEYEARCFVGLVRIEQGTAKRLSEATEVPRTRVYDAVRVLEAQDLVEVRHTNPQQFRAVSIGTAIETLRDRYEARIGRLRESLETVAEGHGDDSVEQLWPIVGREPIEDRVEELIAAATDEVVLVIGDRSLLTDDLVAALDSVESDVDLLVGGVTEPIRGEIRAAVPNATTFVSGPEWLRDEGVHEERATAGRLLLVDRTTVLVSSVAPETGQERAVSGGEFGAGPAAIARRLMVQGLLSDLDSVP